MYTIFNITLLYLQRYLKNSQWHYTCYDFGGGVEEAILTIIGQRLWGWWPARPGTGLWGRPGWSRQRPRVEGRVQQWVGLRRVQRRGAGWCWGAGWGGVRLPHASRPGGDGGERWLRGRVAGRVDLRALLARVAFGGEGWVVRGGLLTAQLRRKGAGLPGRGWGLLLGTYG